MTTLIQETSPQSYQLTEHPSGSKREFWALSWPLMIGLLSSTLMMFVDRLFLAKWNPLALNAAVAGGMAYYIFLVIPMGIVEIAEILVGRLNGEKRNHEIGSAAWQMVWVSVGLLPIFLVLAWLTPHLLFEGTSNALYETEYFRTLMYFAPLQCISIALSGFFIGVGNVKIVTFSAMIGNLVNITLDYWFIFGGGPIPSMGVAGAALATGCALVLQVLFQLVIYWKKQNRQKYGTNILKVNTPFLKEGLRIGWLSGAGRSIEIVAHFLFFRIVTTVGPEQMALVAIAQSIYILSSFIIEAQSKTASAIASNLLGANKYDSLDQVLRSGFIVHCWFFLAFFAFLISFPEQIYALFSAEEGVGLQMTPELMAIFERALIGVGLFFLLDGFGWILTGFLTAAKDTRFVFWASLLINWIAYVPPTLWFVGWNKGGADVAWAIIVGVTALTVALYFWRYWSGKWLKADQERPVL